MKILRNIAGLVIGIAVGAFVNGQLISLNGSLVPLPEGVNPQNIESLKAGMHLYTPLNYLVVFLAHSIGTLVGALLAGFIAQSAKLIFCYVVGSVFLLGGIAMVIMLPSPLWFAFVDLAFAYIPVAWLAAKFVKK